MYIFTSVRFETTNQTLHLHGECALTAGRFLSRVFSTARLATVPRPLARFRV